MPRCLCFLNLDFRAGRPVPLRHLPYPVAEQLDLGLGEVAELGELGAGREPHIPGTPDLAVIGPSFLSLRGPKPATGRPIGRDSLVAAQAVPGTEFSGPSLEGVEAFDRREPPIPDD